MWACGLHTYCVPHSYHLTPLKAGSVTCILQKRKVAREMTPLATDPGSVAQGAPETTVGGGGGGLLLPRHLL